jgi:hypothetical protein
VLGLYGYGIADSHAKKSRVALGDRSIHQPRHRVASPISFVSCKDIQGLNMLESSIYLTRFTPDHYSCHWQRLTPKLTPIFTASDSYNLGSPHSSCMHLSYSATSTPPYMRSPVCSLTGSPHWHKWHQTLMCTAQQHFVCVLCNLKCRRILVTRSNRSYVRWSRVQTFEQKRDFRPSGLTTHDFVSGSHKPLSPGVLRWWAMSITLIPFAPQILRLSCLFAVQLLW